MSLRKRSHKWGSDKWLSVAFHNARVDIHRNKKAKAEREKRLGAVRGKLRGEGIDESWAYTALEIMDRNGYGLNQFSTRTLPVLRESIREAAANERRAAEEASNRAAVRERTRIANASAANDRKEAKARSRTEMSEATAVLRLSTSRRKELSRKAKARPTAPPDTTGPVDPITVSQIAKADVIAELTSDLGRVEATLASGAPSRGKLMTAIGSSPFFKSPRMGITANLVMSGVDAFCLCVVAFVLFGVFRENETAKTVVAVGILLSPLWLLWRFVRRRRTRLVIAWPTVNHAVIARFNELAPISGLAAPSMKKAELPADLVGRLAAAKASVAG